MCVKNSYHTSSFASSSTTHVLWPIFWAIHQFGPFSIYERDSRVIVYIYYLSVIHIL
jgi:hypothetical protein